MSLANFPDWFPPDYINKAEEISAYLVMVRGGAPFLSGADCHLLIEWLDDDIPLSTILSTIDRVSLKRRSKRVRTRLTLKACQGTLNKALGKPKAKKPAQKQSLSGIEKWLSEIKGLRLAPALRHPHQLLLKNCTTHIHNQKYSATDCASALITECRIFHDTVWQESMEERMELETKAEQELAHLSSLLRGRAWKDALEEVMRDHVRSRYPLVNAQAVWDAINSQSTE